MKLSVKFPSVAYREGPAAVTRLAKAIEDIGFDQLDMFDHVLMGYPTETRPAPIYPPQMPIMEALMVLAYAAAVTERIGLGTEVLVLPQRQPVLVAKQISTLDSLSGGRVRLGVGVGWQTSEFDALEEEFSNRGRRMDEAFPLLERANGRGAAGSRQFRVFLLLRAHACRGRITRCGPPWGDPEARPIDRGRASGRLVGQRPPLSNRGIVLHSLLGAKSAGR